MINRLKWTDEVMLIKRPITRQIVALNDGTSVVIRPMRSTDVSLLFNMHRYLSKDTLYSRYMGVYRPTCEDMRNIWFIHKNSGSVLVAVVEGPVDRVIGLAYYATEGDGHSEAAEFAMVVDDEFQGRGLGKTLFRQLIRQALEQELNELTAVSLPSNRSILHLVRTSGYPVETETAYGVREMHIQLNKSTLHQPKLSGAGRTHIH